jgi:hypothetical protein
VVRRSSEEVTVEVTVRLGGSLLDMEGAIQEANNALGRCATEEALERFDTDGSPIRVGEIKLTARGRDPKEYQTPYGPVPVERYVYQGSRGGRIDCPLEHRARIVRGATPLFASQISLKYAQLNVRAVLADLEQNHGRKVAASYIQNVAERVGTIAAAKSPPRPSTASRRSCSAWSARSCAPSSTSPRRTTWASPTVRPAIGANSGDSIRNPSLSQRPT